MLFAKQLRERIRRGEITCSVRIWMRPHVKVGGRYRMDGGFIDVTSLRPITREDITPAPARPRRRLLAGPPTSTAPPGRSSRRG